jgi:chromosome segregation ATPase
MKRIIILALALLTLYGCAPTRVGHYRSPYDNRGYSPREYSTRPATIEEEIARDQYELDCLKDHLRYLRDAKRNVDESLRYNKRILKQLRSSGASHYEIKSAKDEVNYLKLDSRRLATEIRHTENEISHYRKHIANLRKARRQGK